MKKFIGITLLLITVGCKRHNDTPERHVQVLTDAPIQLTDEPRIPIPEGFSVTSHLGNIDFTSRLLGLEHDDEPGVEILVYIKRSNDGEWEQIQTYLTPQTIPMYTHNLSTHEIRFQNCEQGWLYAVYVLAPIQR